MKNIIKIQDINIPELSLYRDYNENQLKKINEPNPGVFIAETEIVTERAIEAGYEPISMLLDEGVRINGHDLMLKCNHIPIYIAEHEKLVNMTGYNLTRGVICAMKRKPLEDAGRLLLNTNRIAILEEVMNPTNVGAIFRSAAAMGINAILLTGGCADPLYRRAIRVSMGNVFNVPWTYIKGSCNDEIERLKEDGFFTGALALNDNSISIADPILKEQKKIALVLGTEGTGLRKETIEACDAAVKIPMKEGIDSLNVAAASAVAFWEIQKSH